jgi:glycosyltransferase involved in cell wall biosynthesis
MEIITVVFVHYGQNEHRIRLAQESFRSLYKTVAHLPVELVIVDNGGGNSKFFIEQMDKGRITRYIRNDSNVWFGRGRNQAISECLGDYICVMDDDLVFENGWLDESIKMLKQVHHEKCFVTPLEIDRAHTQAKYHRGHFVDDNDVKYALNAMAGSNCWVMTKEHWNNIGGFMDNPIAGTKWAQLYCKLGYKVLVLKSPLAGHLGLKGTPYKGYGKHKTEILAYNIEVKLINGEIKKLYP